MRLEYYPIDKLKKEILDILSKYLDLNLYKVFFFGSRVSDRGDDRSDIDIGILGPEEIPANIFLEIQEEIEEKIPTLYKIDVVDFSKVDNDFREISLKEIEYIN